MRRSANRRIDVPRKGNVDRNSIVNGYLEVSIRTFPARGTWIEIKPLKKLAEIGLDVPRKGNVDRNLRFVRQALANRMRRSPQGERG